VSASTGRRLAVAAAAFVLLCLCGGGVATGVTVWLATRSPSLAKHGGVEMVLRTDPDHRDEAMTVIRTRLDEAGIRGAALLERDDDRIVVQVPGTTDDHALVELLIMEAKLEFLAVSTNTDTVDLTTEAEAYRRDSARVGELITDAEVDTHLQSLLHGDLLVRWSYDVDEISGKRTRDEAYALHPDAQVDGTMIADASVATDQFGVPYVALDFNDRGSEAFCQLTDDLEGSFLAMVVDGEVLSAPRVDEPICGGRARITMGGYRDPQEVLQEAQDLAITLRAGSLPAPVELESVQVIGPAG